MRSSLSSLDVSLTPMREWFNAEADHVRLLAIQSAT